MKEKQIVKWLWRNPKEQCVRPECRFFRTFSKLWLIETVACVANVTETRQ